MNVQFRHLLLLTTCVLVLCACRLSQFTGGSENRATNSNQPTTGSAFAPSGDARKDLRDALMKLNTSYPYRLTETMSDLTNGKITMPGGTRVVEFAAADRVHMKSTGELAGDVEAITIGDKHYWYSGGKWTESSIARADPGDEFRKKLAEMIKDVKYVGAETVNGTACHLYTCIFDGSMSGQSWSGTSKVWVRAADGLPHQSDSDLKFGDSYSGKSHVVYEYNVNFKVEKPAM